ncbi:hypothetical protein RND71_006497 [Anisodus tanguticus]|uniref:Sugar phosphate transporter domain-containing protein n=1 Tax=Anisodus tanguticus TaxID=243964 RepID=A0AAE1VW84_9SOLA|nr:hypothetical protein RND71_006497 [Anisodus tanguticus]
MSNDVEDPKGGDARMSLDSSSPSPSHQPISLLSINKWAIMKFPYPGALTALQYFTSAAGVLMCGWLKLIEHDKLDLLTVARFLPAAIFYLSLFTNSELLLHANVDSFIVFRSAVPIFVAIGETLYLHQPWPAMKTWLSLGTIFAGSVLYVSTDYQFTLTAYSWAVTYLVSMSIDFVYIKHVVMTIGLNGLVLYNNLEALLLFPIELLIMDELTKIKNEIEDESDWHSFQVLYGINTKLIGTVGLLICMSGGVMYQQSTSNKPKAVKDVNSQEADEEEQLKLLEMQSNTQNSDNQKQGTFENEGIKEGTMESLLPLRIQELAETPTISSSIQVSFNDKNTCKDGILGAFQGAKMNTKFLEKNHLAKGTQSKTLNLEVGCPRVNVYCVSVPHL